MSRLLITTSHQKTWLVNEPVVFLGEWCKKYDQKHIWSLMDAVVSPPHGLNSKQRIDDIDEMDTLFKSILKDLSIQLNRFHGVSYSIRYWYILLGPWLNSYLRVIMNRYKTLEYVLNNYGVSKTIFLANKHLSLTPKNYIDFRMLINSDLWNNNIYINILNDFKGHKIGVATVNNDDIIDYKITNTASSENIKSRVYNKIKHMFAKSAEVFKKNSDAFIVSSYLPALDEIKLQVLLGQFPQKWFSPKLVDFSVNFTDRKKTIIKI